MRLPCGNFLSGPVFSEDEDVGIGFGDFFKGLEYLLHGRGFSTANVCFMKDLLTQVPGFVFKRFDLLPGFPDFQGSEYR